MCIIQTLTFQRPSPNPDEYYVQKCSWSNMQKPEAGRKAIGCLTSLTWGEFRNFYLNETTLNIRQVKTDCVAYNILTPTGTEVRHCPKLLPPFQIEERRLSVHQECMWYLAWFWRLLPYNSWWAISWGTHCRRIRGNVKLSSYIKSCIAYSSCIDYQAIHRSVEERTQRRRRNPVRCLCLGTVGKSGPALGEFRSLIE